MNARKVPERLLSNAEAAEVLGLEPRALERLRNKPTGDRGPVVTYVGRSPRYSRRSLAAYLESNARYQHGR